MALLHPVEVVEISMCGSAPTGAGSVDLQDDLMAATRYGYMMLRYAVTPPDPHKQALNHRRDYDWRAG